MTFEVGHRHDADFQLPFPLGAHPERQWQRMYVHHGADVLGDGCIDVPPAVLRTSVDGIAAYVTVARWLDVGEVADHLRLADELFGGDIARALRTLAELFSAGLFVTQAQHAHDAEERARDFNERLYGSRDLPEDFEWGSGPDVSTVQVRFDPAPNHDDGSWSGEWPLKSGDHAPPTSANVVYVLRDGNGAPLYAGSTSRFRHRMKEHRKLGKEWARWTAFPCADRAAAYEAEAVLINELEPPLNVHTWVQGVA